MKKLFFFILWIVCFNPGNATTHVIKVWSGYYQFVDNSFQNLNTTPLVIQLGDTVQWLPLDVPMMAHTITSTTIPAGAIAFDQVWNAPADTFFQYVPLVVGTYNFECTPHASMNMNGSIVVQAAAGITANQAQTNISVYPNPSTGQFQFSIDNSKSAKSSKIEIFNAQGEKIYQSFFTNTSFGIDLSDQSKGIYFINFYDGQTIRAKKIVIQ